MNILWWTRRDLRLADNALWDDIQERLSEPGSSLTILREPHNAEHARISESPLALPRMSSTRQRWEEQAWESFGYQVRQYGLSHRLVQGPLLDYLAKHHVDLVVFSHGYAWEERQAEKALIATGIAHQGFHTYTLFSPEEALSAVLEPTFTPFRKRIEAHRGAKTFALGPSKPPEISPSPMGAFTLPARPTEADAWTRLHEYIRPHGPATQYKTQRNGMLRWNDSTKFSLYLSLGLLSPQRIWNACLELEKQLGGSEEVYWIRFELLWREYFQWVAYTEGTRLFRPGGLKESGPSRISGDARRLNQWITGRTGDALVDAGMRELAATGYTSNRARQNLASYWIHTLQQPWRIGAAYFESQLLDYDPAANWGNWAYLAQCGNDPRPIRQFNTLKQAETYDPDGSYRRKWAGYNV